VEIFFVDIVESMLGEVMNVAGGWNGRGPAIEKLRYKKDSFKKEFKEGEGNKNGLKTLLFG